MADRFPALDDLDSLGTPGAGDVDTTAASTDDFLARERALLGDDATQFTTSNDNAAFAEDDNDDLLGGSGDHQGGGEDMDTFQSSFPAIDSSNDHMSHGGSITGPSYPSTYTAPSDEAEPEPIRAWRERRDAQLQERAERSAAKKAETIKAAQQSIDEFYENYNAKKEKNIAQTRREAEEFLASREDTSAGGTSWERIAKLVDLSGKGVKGGAAGTGKERFREMLMSLKKDEKAPGASGY